MWLINIKWLCWYFDWTSMSENFDNYQILQNGKFLISRYGNYVTKIEEN